MTEGGGGFVSRKAEEGLIKRKEQPEAEISEPTFSETAKTPQVDENTVILSDLRNLGKISFFFGVLEIMLALLLMCLIVALKKPRVSSDHLLVEIVLFLEDSFIPITVFRRGTKISISLLFLVALLLSAVVKMKVAFDAVFFGIHYQEQQSINRPAPETLGHIILQRVHYQTLIGSAIIFSLNSLPVLFCTGHGHIGWVVPIFFINLMGSLLLLSFSQNSLLLAMFRLKGASFMNWVASAPLYICQGLCLLGGFACNSLPWVLGLRAILTHYLLDQPLPSEDRRFRFIAVYAACGFVLSLFYSLPVIFTIHRKKGWFYFNLAHTIHLFYMELLFFVLVFRETYSSTVFDPSLLLAPQST